MPWIQLRMGNLKWEIEFLFIEEQIDAIRNNYVKTKIDYTQNIASIVDVMIEMKQLTEVIIWWILSFQKTTV